ncbi:MAG: hypothetical protein MSC30_13260 [Gaiellaceae bacterium MAG52_C11]|nr:hypothetical protein [Candidatus Gaiellasilicea maunaloa]
MIRDRRLAVLVLALAAVLAIGVSAAWAGFPNFRVVESTFDPGTATAGGGTSSRVALAAATAASFSPATLYVRFSATHADKSSTFVPYAEGTQGWACADAHGAFAGATAVDGPVAALGRHLTLSSDARGRIVYNGNGLAIGLRPPESLSCSSGQTALLVRLSLSKLVLRVVGETHEQTVHYPTSDGWVGQNYTRHGFPG